MARENYLLIVSVWVFDLLHHVGCDGIQDSDKLEVHPLVRIS